MDTFSLLISNPQAHTHRFNDSIWVISGSGPERAAAEIENISSFNQAVERVASMAGEYSLIAVEGGDDPSINAYRGITSSYDVFYTQRSDGTVIVGDHFRDVLSQLPVSSRTVPDNIGVTQLLFGTKPQGGYIKEIGRLGHGSILRWEGDEPSVEVTHSLSFTPNGSRQKVKQRLDELLDSYIKPLSSQYSAATMLSGGVDSTLIQAYSESDETVSASLNSPSYQSEVEYAKQASSLLNTDHEFLDYNERDFVSLVEQAVDATGHPLLHLQTSLINQVFGNTDYDVYFNGEYGDSVFGRSDVATYKIAYLLRYLIDYVPKFDSRIGTLQKYKNEITRPVEDVDGYGMNPSLHSNEDLIDSIYGRKAVNQQKMQRMNYTNKRVYMPGNTGFGPHTHLAHFISFFQGNTATLWRHAAHAQGKSLITPFTAQESVKAALSLPAHKRYVNKLESKYLLKQLLKEKVPGYDTGKSKLGSGVNTSRYLSTGPLSSAFDQYDIPDFIPEKRQKEIETGTGHESWFAFSYAVWRDRILENDDLELLDNTQEISGSFDRS